MRARHPLLLLVVAALGAGAGGAMAQTGTTPQRGATASETGPASTTETTDTTTTSDQGTGTGQQQQPPAETPGGGNGTSTGATGTSTGATGTSTDAIDTTPGATTDATTGGKGATTGGKATTAPKIPMLSLSVTGAPAFDDLRPGATSTVGVPVAVDAQDTSWSLHLSPGDGGSPTPGHLRAASGPECAHGVRSLDSPLHISVGGAGPTTSVDLPEYDLGSQDDPQIAHGTASDTLQVTYSQTIAPDEPIQEGCGYSVAVTWTVVAG